MKYDAIVIGGGHNGLTAAAVLARAKKRVLLLESRSVLGGAAATEEIWPDYRANTGAEDAALFPDFLVKELYLQMAGLSFIEPAVSLFAPQPDGSALTLWRDVEKSAAAISARNVADGERYRQFAAQVEQYSGMLADMLRRVPPDALAAGIGDARAWGPLLLKLRGLGKTEMMNFMRVLPMPLQTYLDEWFADPALRGALGSYGLQGLREGPRSAGTALMFFYQQAGGFLRTRFVRGGMGQLSEALAATAKQAGAEVRTGAKVASFRLRYDDAGYHAVGVRLVGGEEIETGQVLSSADPRTTLFDLVGPQHLEPHFMRQVRNFKYRGSTARLLLALDGLPTFVGQSDEDQLRGHIRVATSLDYLEQAYDHAKYGEWSDKPALDMVIPTLSDPTLAPNGKHILSITIQFAPYQLREGDWDARREEFADHVMARLEEVAPGIGQRVLHRHLITPLDYEREYELPEGSIHHGQMTLDQLLVMRPAGGWGRYRMPVHGLYLCGAGAHPGGGVTGLPGYLGARVALG